MMRCECNAYETKIPPRTAKATRPGLARARGCCMICWLPHDGERHHIIKWRYLYYQKYEVLKNI
jgi:hypothetical protein